MKRLHWLAPAVLVLGCSSASGTTLTRCSCAVTAKYTSGGAVLPQAPFDLELCLTDPTQDPIATAQSECVAMENQASGGALMNTCACSCIHTTEDCLADAQ